MSVKIRLTRMGKKKQPSYRVVVMDSRKPRDGKYIEQIGRYDPRQEPSLVEIDNDRAVTWLSQGAQPTERARKLLQISGAWTQFRVIRGDIHTVGEEEIVPEPEPVVLEDLSGDAATTEASSEEAVEDAGDTKPAAASAGSEADEDGAAEPTAEEAPNGEDTSDSEGTEEA